MRTTHANCPVPNTTFIIYTSVTDDDSEKSERRQIAINAVTNTPYIYTRAKEWDGAWGEWIIVTTPVGSNNVNITMAGATNVDSVVKIKNGSANLTICVRIPAIQKNVEYTLGTCNTYTNHYVRHTGSIVTNGNIEGSVFFTIYPTGVVKFISSVDTSGETVLNDDIMYLTF